MSNWNHRHVIDLSTFSLEDYSKVLELANRFNALPNSGARKLPALQGRLITTLFFEPSTRTRSSFEIAAKRLSADVINFSSSTSSISKGESPLDTALTYVAMGSDVLIVRHKYASVPLDLARYLDNAKKNTLILNGGNGLHSHPSQGLLDLFTLAQYFNPQNPSPKELKGKRIVIAGDILHSRVARSNLWSLTGCGADVTLCGPPSLLPEEFADFVKSSPPGQNRDPIKKRGCIAIQRSLKDALQDADALMTLRVQKERMEENLLTDLDNYHLEYGINQTNLDSCPKSIPILHPGPVNRGIEINTSILESRSTCLIEKQIENGIPIRMALLYLMAASPEI